MVLLPPRARLMTLCLPAMVVLVLGACQTTGGKVGSPQALSDQTASPQTAATPNPESEGDNEGDAQEVRAVKAGFTQITDSALRSLISGHSYAYDHPKGARITVSFSPDGHTTGTWSHPSGMTGSFEESWVIRNGDELCGVSDEGTKCGTLYRKDDLLVKIYDSGRVDKLDPVQNLAIK
ncbi:hypothetical protein [Rhodospirillum sp. A1_3_36]|uniref:hypothetical protein n=1 Tax=Rhodospirillum sp. A1_3_36 TaxID=3391666 RepID=UPI0039A49722